MPGQVISGKHALYDSRDIFTKAGSHALIVTGKVMEKIGNVGTLTKLLDDLFINYTVYSDITGEPTDKMIEKGVEVYKENGCDFLIGLGGGSPLDSMKAIGAMVTNPGKISDYMGKIIENPLPKMIAIPTTAGTGSEATWFTIITDTNRDIKMLLKGPVLMPDVSIIDYEFTMTAPKSITAATGLDALTHAIEGYTSRRAQPLTDSLALSAVKRIFKYLPIAYVDGSNEKARTQMSIAALEAGIVINNSSVTIVHGMSRPIGAIFHVPHGISNAMLLRECLAFAYEGVPEKFADLARAIGVAGNDESDLDACKKFIGALEQLCALCEVPTLEQYGIDKEMFLSVVGKMADDALASGSPANTYKKITKEDITVIYKRLWE